MIVKAKERKEMIFQELKVGEVFEDNDGDILMKVRFEDDYVCCPRCDEDIHINDERGDSGAVELSTGLVYDFEWCEKVRPIQGYFIEE